MPVVVVIPVRAFGDAKQRLSDALAPDSRRFVAKALAGHVAGTVAEAGHTPMIVTADPEVSEWATRLGFPPLADSGSGLNAAARTGVEWAVQAASPWLVVHADLPLLETRDIDSLVASLATTGSVISPSSDGGTSAIGSSGNFEFTYGISSFHRHLRRLPSADVVFTRGLAFDVDTLSDVRNAASAGVTWLEVPIHG